MPMFPSLDHNEKLILGYIALKGPITMYRVARDLSYHFSHTYRKAAKLEKLGLIRKGPLGRAAQYEATIYGYMYCYANGIEPKEVLLAKISKLLGLSHFTLEEVEGFLKFYLSIADNHAPVNGFLTMTSYILEKCNWDPMSCLNGGSKEQVLTSRVISYGIVSLIKRIYNHNVIVADDDYFVVFDTEKWRIVAAHCKLCGRDKYCSLDPCPTLTKKVELKLKALLGKSPLPKPQLISFKNYMDP